MAVQDFAKVGVAMDGNVLNKLTNVEWEANAGLQRVDLLNEGLGGFTPGSGEVTINLGFVVPLGGFEEDYTKKLTDYAVVSMQIFCADKDYVGKGKIQNVKISQSVNGATEGTLQWMGELKPFQ